ncbi:MAG: oligoendopeptidase F [Spirochaetes bacterium GWC1_27_15]|nr:MAG: oligoendopeptidase F [Spirochaetes bacterium GWB1_27_13]OHD26779.1 MAG: oligoendopeptidase F [Spirochaetes bacterium GWC1_27_15]
MPTKREEIKENDKWNVYAIFANDNLWEEELKVLQEEIKKITQFKGKLKDSAKIIKDTVDFSISLDLKLGKVYTYAHMKHDEDSKNETYKNSYEKAYSLAISYDELSSWITPELIAIPDDLMNSYLNSDELKPYKFYFEKILRAKEHILSEKEEKILSMASKALSTAEDAFRSLNDADLKFGLIDKDGSKQELTHSLYYIYLIDKDRKTRENAFKQYHNKFDEFPTTFASLLSGEMKSHSFNAKVRNFSSSLEASLFYKNVDTTVYTNLIDTVHKRIDSLHRYLSYRKKKMGLSDLHLYDVYVPFVKSPEIKMTYDEARDTLLDSVKILGEEYHSTLKKGLYEDGWVDKYENENKRSGAYSTGSYLTMPYILMNYNGTLSSARTLAHEAGHSMHSYFTHKYQPPIYGSYPIFLAEVASTFNEELFNHYQIEHSKDKEKIAYLINSRLEEIRTTLFRQTMFAEFELLIHKLVESDTPLTFQLLKKEYKKINEFYFGKEVVIDPEIEIEWARIPHFYYNYYVYQYATGISAAIALYQNVINGGQKEKDQYLGFLKAGNSKFPIDILKDAGVDMGTPKPIEKAIDYFDDLLKELEKLD